MWCYINIIILIVFLITDWLCELHSREQNFHDQPYKHVKILRSSFSYDFDRRLQDPNKKYFIHLGNKEKLPMQVLQKSNQLHSLYIHDKASLF